MFPKFFKNVGFVRTVADGIVTAVGLDLVQYGEMLLFSNRGIGVVLSLEKMTISAIVLGSDTQIFPGDFVFRTAKLMGVYVSSALLGSIVSPLGRRLTKKKNTSDNDHNSKYLSGKYVEFKDLFSIFYLDPSSFKDLMLRDGDIGHFTLSSKSLIKNRYMLGFASDYAKLLLIRKTFSQFIDVKEVFKSSDISFVKTSYRNNKLLSMIFDSSLEDKNLSE